nr:60S ribosomal protein L10a-2-like [Rhipicephalus microplus]
MGANLNVPAQPEEPEQEAPGPAPAEPAPPPPRPSKPVSQEKLYECVNGVLEAATKKRRAFLETVDLFVTLQDYNLQKYRRLRGIVKMPYPVKQNLRVCVFGDATESEEAKAMNLGFMVCAQVLQLKRKSKAIRQLASKYDVFLAPEALVRDLNQVLGQGFSQEHKCITAVAPTESIPAKLEELKHSTRIWMKAKATFSIRVGHVNMSADQLAENVKATETQLLERLKKGWDHVHSLVLKSTMGPAFKLC